MATNLTFEVGPPRLRSYRLRLRNLPYEIRMIIYSLVLIEPALWDRTHDLTCEYKPFRRDSDDDKFYETPPFCLQSTSFPRWNLVTRTACSCGKRKGLGLLLANRQIYDEAHPILWTQNMFCFKQSFVFTAAVGSDLPVKLREQIRSLSITRPKSLWSSIMFAPHGERPTEMRDAFWHTVRQCKSLERLEIPPELIEHFGRPSNGGLDGLARQLPNLAGLELTCFGTNLASHSMRTWSPWDTFDYSASSDYFLKFSYRLALSDTDNNIDPVTASRYTSGAFDSQVTSAVERQVLKSWSPSRPYSYRNSKIPADLNEHNNVRHVTIDNGEKVSVTFYGLPVTRSDVAAAIQQRAAEEREFKAKHNVTPAHRQEILENAMRRRELREEEAAQVREEYDLLVLRRKTRDLAVSREAKEAEKVQKAKVKRIMKQNAENRVKERKRTNRV